MSKPGILLRQMHRWVGLVFSVSVLMSAGSGVLHSVMSRTQPPPPQARPGGQGLDVSQIRFSIQDALAKINHPDFKVQAVSVRSIGGQPWYQFLGEGKTPPVYVSAADGSMNERQDEIYAGQIASESLGGKAVRKTDYLTRFNNEYIAIFRILPVYRFDAGDERGTRLYVSTMTGSVTRATDNRKQFEANVFTNIHKFGFIPNKDVRDFVLTFCTGGIFLVSLLGIALFFATGIPKKR